jgi:hypothetical protein
MGKARCKEELVDGLKMEGIVDRYPPGNPRHLGD